MNHQRKTLIRGRRDYSRDLTAFSATSDIHGGSREVQL
jgi:hypothetical protein